MEHSADPFRVRVPTNDPERQRADLRSTRAGRVNVAERQAMTSGQVGLQCVQKATCGPHSRTVCDANYHGVAHLTGLHLWALWWRPAGC